MDHKRPVGAWDRRIANIAFLASKRDQVCAGLVREDMSIYMFRRGRRAIVINIVFAADQASIAVADDHAFFIDDAGTSGAADDQHT